MTDDDRENGTIRVYNADKGFGFITPKGGGKDVFFDVTAFNEADIDNIREHSAVSYISFTNKMGELIAAEPRLES